MLYTATKAGKEPFLKPQSDYPVLYEGVSYISGNTFHVLQFRRNITVIFRINSTILLFNTLSRWVLLYYSLIQGYAC